MKRDKSVKGAKKGSLAPADKAEPPAKKPISRIDTNMVKLKLLDATRKSIMDKTKKVCVSSYAQTDSFKTKLCKDQSIEAQNDLRVPCDASTETEIELVATVAKDGTRKLSNISQFHIILKSRSHSHHHVDLCRQHRSHRNGLCFDPDRHATLRCIVQKIHELEALDSIRRRNEHQWRRHGRRIVRDRKTHEV